MNKKKSINMNDGTGVLRSTYLSSDILGGAQLLLDYDGRRYRVSVPWRTFCEEWMIEEAIECFEAVEMGDYSEEKFETKKCPYRIQPPIIRRPGNALNIEIGKPLPRCRLKTPKNWGDADPTASRWINSGGTPEIFGTCLGNCPRRKEGEIK